MSFFIVSTVILSVFCIFTYVCLLYFKLRVIKQCKETIVPDLENKVLLDDYLRLPVGMPLVKGDVSSPSIIDSRKVVFTDANHYSPFFMPEPGLYGEIMYILRTTHKPVVINYARTTLKSEMQLEQNYVTLFWSNTCEWVYIGMTYCKRRHTYK